MPFNADTSGITRIEAGTREPRLSEVIAIAAVLDLALNDLTPALGFNRKMGDLTQQMLESRETLLAVLESVDGIVEYATKQPTSLGGDALATVLNRQLDGFKKTLDRRAASDAGKPKKPAAANGKLKSQVLGAVTANLPVPGRKLLGD